MRRKLQWSTLDAYKVKKEYNVLNRSESKQKSVSRYPNADLSFTNSEIDLRSLIRPTEAGYN